MISEVEERIITDAAMAVIAAKDAKRNQMKLQEVLNELMHQLDWQGPTGKQMGHIVLARADAATLVQEVCSMKVELQAMRQDNGAVIAGLQGEIKRLRAEIELVSK